VHVLCAPPADERDEARQSAAVHVAAQGGVHPRPPPGGGIRGRSPPRGGGCRASSPAAWGRIQGSSPAAWRRIPRSSAMCRFRVLVTSCSAPLTARSSAYTLGISGGATLGLLHAVGTSLLIQATSRRSLSSFGLVHGVLSSSR